MKNYYKLSVLCLLSFVLSIGATASVASDRLHETTTAFVSLAKATNADKSGVIAAYVAAYRRASLGEDIDINLAITRAIGDFIEAAETMPPEARTKALAQLKSKLKLDDTLREGIAELEQKTLALCREAVSPSSLNNIRDGAKTAAEYRARRRSLWL